MNDSSLPACVINCVAYNCGGERRDINLNSISDVLAIDDGAFVWVGLYEPDEPTLAKLQQEFDLHDLAVEDAHHAHQRPKLETYGQSLFIALHTAQNIDDHIHIGETHIFLAPRYLVTVRHGASASYATTRKRVEYDTDLLQHGPSAALYAVLDMVVDNYLPIVDGFRDALGVLEQDIFAENYSKDTIKKLYELKTELTRFRMAVSPLQDVLAHLTRENHKLINAEMQLYFRDVLDHTVQINERADMLREMLTTAINVNLALVTMRQGEVVKRLGAWAALLAVPTLIASWYGMNFKVMPELGFSWSYPILFAMVGVISVLLFRILRRARWL